MTTPRTLILATRNQGKVRELRDPLARFGFDVQSLPEDFPEIEENGTTFEENALIKARAVANALGVAAAADDSGLEVDALGGAPGVYSARYSEDWPAVEGESKDERNNRKLLAELEGVPAEKRTARFRCCMALVIPGGEEIVVSGAWEGSIGFKKAGANGFGYDPLFNLEDIPGKRMAELVPEEKNAISHRRRALDDLVAKLQG